MLGMTMKAGMGMTREGGEWDDKEKGERGTLTFLLVNYQTAVGLDCDFYFAILVFLQAANLWFAFFVVDKNL